MVAESPNLYIANLLKEQQESKDFVRCICMDNNQKRGRAELLQKNWKTILYLLDEAQFVDADTPPKLDLRMEELAKKKSDHPAVKAYQRYRGGPDETIRSVIMTVNVRMQPFDNEELLKIFSSNDIPLDEFGVGIDGDKKTKSNLFIIIPDDDDTFNFVVAMMYSQLFNLLCDRADDVHHGRLPYHVRILCDEFANIGQIPKFDKLIATIRSREISASIILQSQSQLKTIYKDAAETILGNCDTMLFLGGKESSTLKEISETLGKETIDLYNTSDTRGQSRSYGMNYQKTGKELMSRDELAVMDGNKCILQLRGVVRFSVTSMILQNINAIRNCLITINAMNLMWKRT